MKNFDDTICAPATGPGGAIAVIRISGPETFSILDRVVRLKKGSISSTEAYRIRFGQIPDLDEVLVSVFRAPHSYTGEDCAEISCHASAYIVSEILRRLVVSGARMAEPGEFTRRAFLNGKMDLAQAEAVADMISASSEAAHRIALNQLRGTYSNELQELRGHLVELASLLELELDFSEEDVEFANRATLRTLLDSALAHVSTLAGSFRAGNAIRKGVPVAIAGAVNSGKSTLLNALLGENRAIVSDIPGTTRDTVEECIDIDGITFRFIDTAGIRNTLDEVEKMGIERSLGSIAKAEVVIAVLDGSAPANEAIDSLQKIRGRISASQNIILVRNKIDAAPQLAHGFPACDIEISAKKGLGLNALKSRLSRNFSTQTKDANAVLVTNARHHEALCRALESLVAARSGLDRSAPTELIAEDLRAAIRELGSILGEITSDELLGSIFSRFCIGK